MVQRVLKVATDFINQNGFVESGIEARDGKGRIQKPYF